MRYFVPRIQLVPSLLLMIIMGIHPPWVSSSLLPLIIINESTHECLEWRNDFCDKCWIPTGWTSLGTSNLAAAEEITGVGCPPGYDYRDASTNHSALQLLEELESHYCAEQRKKNCCSAPWNGWVPDYCRPLLVVNAEAQKCSLSLCPTLPLGWAHVVLQDDVDDNEADEHAFNCLGWLDYALAYGDEAANEFPGNWSWMRWDDPSLDCDDDPCENESAASSCEACVTRGCSWSPRTLSCHVGCPDSDSDHNWCITSSSSQDEKVARQKCEELALIMADDGECEGTQSCEACQAKALPSNPSQRCRWVDMCQGEPEGPCEHCYANSCFGTCTEMSNCSASHWCPAEVETCTECVQHGCTWGFSFWGSGGGCYRDECPAEADCVSRVRDEVEVSMKRNQEPGNGTQNSTIEDTLLFGVELPMCQDLISQFWDREYCRTKGTYCLDTVLLSNETQHCQKLTFYTDSVGRVARCVPGCPSWADGGCRESTVRPQRRFFYRYCDECLMAEGYWNADPSFLEDADPSFLEDADQSWRRCTEDPCMSTTTTHPEYCLTRNNTLDDQNRSALEYCLRHGQGVATEHPWKCRNYYPKTSCEECLRNGCAWSENECRVNCTHTTSTTNQTDACVQASDLFTVLDDNKEPIPLEVAIGVHCRAQRNDIPCVGLNQTTQESHHVRVSSSNQDAITGMSKKWKLATPLLIVCLIAFINM